MSRRWVVNASPLILLGKVGQLELLMDLSDELIIPRAVVQEVAVKPDGRRAIAQVTSFPATQARDDVAVPFSVSVWDLGSGESQVLAMAHDTESSRAGRLGGMSMCSNSRGSRDKLTTPICEATAKAA